MEDVVEIEVQVHLEFVDGRACWWAESPAVPGFSATADSLPEVISRATWAIQDIFAEEGNPAPHIVPRLVNNDPVTGNVVTMVHSSDAALAMGRWNVAAGHAERVTGTPVPA